MLLQGSGNAHAGKRLEAGKSLSLDFTSLVPQSLPSAHSLATDIMLPSAHGQKGPDLHVTLIALLLCSLQPLYS
jgi:hypothetical protein